MHRVEYVVIALDEKNLPVRKTFLYGAFVHLRDASQAVVQVWSRGTALHSRDYIAAVEVVVVPGAAVPDALVDPA